MIATILAPTDFSDGSRRAIDTAIQFALQFRATLWLIHVGQQAADREFSGSTRAEILHRAREEQVKVAAARMEALADELRAAHPDLLLKTRQVGGTPHAAIIDAATDVGADLIVMGTAGLTGLSHFWLGSTAERVVRMSNVPVLTVRGDD